MSRFAANLKLLRHRKGLSQDILALELDLKRTTLSAYENGQAEPNLDLLGRIAAYFGLRIDSLLGVDLSALTPAEWDEMQRGEAPDLSGRHLRILATSVSPDNLENVEVVPAAARAGYTAGYADPEFVASLPHMSLPFLSPERKYRAFPVDGDSMPPVVKGSYVVGQYLPDWNTLRKGQFAIVVTRQDGIVFQESVPRFSRREAHPGLDQSLVRTVRSPVGRSPRSLDLHGIHRPVGSRTGPRTGTDRTDPRPPGNATWPR